MSPETNERLASIASRLARTTHGPWFVNRFMWKIGSSRGIEDDWWLSVENEDHTSVVRVPESEPNAAANADFIAQAHEDVTWLLATVQALSTEVAGLRGRLDTEALLRHELDLALDDLGGDNGYRGQACGVCSGHSPATDGHSRNCLTGFPERVRRLLDITPVNPESGETP